MKIRWYIDSETGEPHVLRHPVSLDEVEQAVAGVIEDRPGERGARVLIGRTSGGRYLKVIYIRDDEPASIFVIAAYQLGPKAQWALRKRLRRKV